MIIDWEKIFGQITGPLGAIFVLCVVIYFLWKLYREEQEENRKNFDTVRTVLDTLKEIAAEMRGRNSP